jgi:GTPase SAR1 family protein
VQLDFATKQLTIKLVYYGPALSGKTTNLKACNGWESAECHARHPGIGAIAPFLGIRCR